MFLFLDEEEHFQKDLLLSMIVQFIPLLGERRSSPGDYWSQEGGPACPLHLYSPREALLGHGTITHLIFNKIIWRPGGSDSKASARNAGDRG